MKISVQDAHEFFLDDAGYLCDVGYGFENAQTHPSYDASGNFQIVVLLPPQRLEEFSSRYPRIKACLESQNMVFVSDEDYWIDWDDEDLDEIVQLKNK